MSLASAVTKLNSTTRALKDVNVRSLTEALEKELGSRQRLSIELPKIYKRAALGMQPFIRGLLDKHYRESKLDRKSGELYMFSVSRATIRINARGSEIIIAMGAGGSSDVYKRAGAFRYGSVRNTQFRTTYTDLSTGQTKTYKAGKGGVIGAKQKRTIKQNARGQGIKVTGAWWQTQHKQAQVDDTMSTANKNFIITQAKSPFFNLNGDKAEIEQEFIRLVQKEIAAFLKNREAA